MTNNPWQDYIFAPSDQLLIRLADITYEISSLHDQIAFSEANRTRDRANALRETAETTSSGREHYVTMTVVEPVISMIELTAQREALREERSLILTLLAARGQMQ